MWAVLISTHFLLPYRVKTHPLLFALRTQPWLTNYREPLEAANFRLGEDSQQDAIVRVFAWVERRGVIVSYHSFPGSMELQTTILRFFTWP